MKLVCSVEKVWETTHTHLTLGPMYPGCPGKPGLPLAPCDRNKTGLIHCTDDLTYSPALNIIKNDLLLGRNLFFLCILLKIRQYFHLCKH